MAKALRSYKVTVSLTRADKERLEQLAERSYWTPSAAAAFLIKRGLDSVDRSREQQKLTELRPAG